MKIPYFDGHCDTIMKHKPLRKNDCQLDLERLAAYAPSAQIFAIWAPPSLEDIRHYRLTLSRLLKEFCKNSDIVRLCGSAKDAKAAARDGKVAAFISVEGARLLNCSAARLRDAYRCGVRVVTLTWNRGNALAGSAAENGGGLTEKGRSFVSVCQALGVAVDLSHASERAFWDVVGMDAKPAFASHSNAKALCGHFRNLTDGQFTALAGYGGAVGINMYNEFLGLKGDIDAIVAHIEHFCALGGEKTVCLGTDFDGIDRSPEGIFGVQDMGKLYEALLRRNYSEDTVNDIFYGNLLAYLERAL